MDSIKFHKLKWVVSFRKQGFFFIIMRYWYIFFSLLLVPNMPAFSESLWKSRELVFDQKYNELDARFRKADQALIQSKDGADLYYDFVYQSLFKASDLKENSSVITKLHAWSNSHPDSYAPLVALSLYHQQYGNFLRGEKFRKETSEEQIAGMRREHVKAKNYALKAIAINRSAILAYEILILIDSRNSRPKNFQSQEKNIVLQLLCGKNYPILSKDIGCELPAYTFAEKVVFKNAGKGVLSVPRLWSSYLFKNTPRWGGSYERMHRIINASKEYLKESDTYYLAAIEVADRMDRFQRHKEYQKSLDLGRSYLTVGEKKGLPFYRHKARVYVEMMQAAKHLGLLGECIKYGDLSSKIFFWNSRAWADLGYCSIHAKEWDMANFALRYHIDTRVEVDAWALFFLGKSFHSLLDFQAAYTLLKRAENADESYKKYTENDLIWIKKNHPDKAIESNKSILEIIGQLQVDGPLVELSKKY